MSCPSALRPTTTLALYFAAWLLSIPHVWAAPPRLVGPDAAGRLVLRAEDASLPANGPQYETKYGRGNIGFWTNAASVLEFRMQPPPPGTYRLELEYDCAVESAGSEVEIWIGPALAVFRVEATGPVWGTARTASLGAVDIESREPLSVRIKPVKKPGSAVMNFYELRLLPPSK